MMDFADVLLKGKAEGRRGEYEATAIKAPAHPMHLGSADAESATVDHAAHALLGIRMLKSEPVEQKLTHKEVEQHRRMQAKKHFDELRVLLPGGEEQKHDRNKLLAMVIQHVRSLRSGGKAQPVEGELERGGSPPCGMMFEMEEDISKKDQAEKRLSHNEVEQRRRLQAKKHYEELRAMLPNAGKFDKNTLLEHAIVYIKKATGVMGEEHGSASGDGESETAYSRTPSTVAGATHGSWQESMLSGSFTSLASLSSSPTDSANLSQSLNSSSRRGRKRTPSKSIVDSEYFSASILSQSAPSVTRCLQTFDEEHEGLSSEQKKRRTIDASDSDDTDMCLDALSLLSNCAFQISQPNTPAMAPVQAEGSNSEIKPLSLAA